MPSSVLTRKAKPSAFKMARHGFIRVVGDTKIVTIKVPTGKLIRVKSVGFKAAQHKHVARTLSPELSNALRMISAPENATIFSTKSALKALAHINLDA